MRYATVRGCENNTTITSRREDEERERSGEAIEIYTTRYVMNITRPANEHDEVRVLRAVMEKVVK